MIKLLRAALLVGLATIVAVAPAHAQDQDEGSSQRESARTVVQPYIEVSQIVSAELTPGDDVLTYTQIAAGVDISAASRNSGGSLSLRYERNIDYDDDDNIDSDTVSGIARGYLSVIPRALTLEAGALASRSRIDGSGGTTSNPLVRDNGESQIYSGYAGPTLATRVGDVDLTALARVGYTRIEASNAIVNPVGDTVDVFDDSVTYNAQARASTRAGEPLPVGVGIGGGYYQEDISNLDQRVRDTYVRGDLTIPISSTVSVVAGAGYEDVEVSSRDALRDVNGDPVVGSDGRLVTDNSAPRQLAFDIDGFIWDVGVLWRPSSRTSLSATVGERYDSTTYYGNFTYVPNSRSQINISVYDAVSGFGGTLTNSLAALPTEFGAVRNAVSGDFGGCVGGDTGANCVGTLGSVRSAAFRGRGVQASYQRRIGRLNAAIAAGYDRRRFIAAPGTVLADANGLVDETYYLQGALTRSIGNNASLQTNAYVNWFESGNDLTSNGVTAYGASAAYNQSIAGNLSARAALAIDYLDSDLSSDDFAFATALFGLRYDF